MNTTKRDILKMLIAFGAGCWVAAITSLMKYTKDVERVREEVQSSYIEGLSKSCIEGTPILYIETDDGYVLTLGCILVDKRSKNPQSPEEIPTA